MQFEGFESADFRDNRDVEQYVRHCLDQAGLQDWSFAWDHARRRLGSCRYTKKQISLSKHFVALNFHQPHEIRDTVLHEIAHALAWQRHGERQHGPYWRHYCRELGAEPRATARPQSVEHAPYKYILRMKDTGEVVGGYYRKPRFSRNIASVMLRGRPETRGMLELVRAQL